MRLPQGWKVCVRKKGSPRLPRRLPVNAEKPSNRAENKSYSQVSFAIDRAYTAPRAAFERQETPPMNKAVEVFLTVLALAGMYCAIPKSTVQGGPTVRAQQEVMIADGSDPMPLCRARRCK
jgi:hypothetical protein